MSNPKSAKQRTTKLANTIEFLKAAEQVARNSNCVRRHVGCVLVRNSRIVATGWNGVHTSPNFNCVNAGCPRCKASDTVTGIGYDRCLCVHAEQVAIAEAARNGVSLDGTVLFNTLRPCLNCAASALLAGVKRIVYRTDWQYSDTELEEAHARIRAKFEEFLCVPGENNPHDWHLLEQGAIAS
jgi:dCMP deaminase